MTALLELPVLVVEEERARGPLALAGRWDRSLLRHHLARLCAFPLHFQNDPVVALDRALHRPYHVRHGSLPALQGPHDLIAAPQRALRSDLVVGGNPNELPRGIPIVVVE